MHLESYFIRKLILRVFAAILVTLPLSSFAQTTGPSRLQPIELPFAMISLDPTPILDFIDPATGKLKSRKQILEVMETRYNIKVILAALVPVGEEPVEGPQFANITSEDLEDDVVRYYGVRFLDDQRRAPRGSYLAAKAFPKYDMRWRVEYDDGVASLVLSAPPLRDFDVMVMTPEAIEQDLVHEFFHFLIAKAHGVQTAEGETYNLQQWIRMQLDLLEARLGNGTRDVSINQISWEDLERWVWLRLESVRLGLGVEIDTVRLELEMRFLLRTPVRALYQRFLYRETRLEAMDILVEEAKRLIEVCLEESIPQDESGIANVESANEHVEEMRQKLAAERSFAGYDR